MQHTHFIDTTSTVMRGSECVLQADLKVEVECDDGTDFSIASFGFGTFTITRENDPHLFAVLLEGIDKRDMLDRVATLYSWKYDSETGTMTCTGLAS